MFVGVHHLDHLHIPVQLLHQVEGEENWPSSPDHNTRYSLTHSLTYLLSHSLSHSLTHLLTYLLTHSLTYLLTHVDTDSLSYLKVDTKDLNASTCKVELSNAALSVGTYEDVGTHLLWMVEKDNHLEGGHLLTHSLTHSPNSLTYSLTYSLTHSLTHSQVTWLLIAIA